MSKQEWTFTEGLDTDLVEVNYVSEEAYLTYFSGSVDTLTLLDIRPVYLNYGEIHSPIPYEEVTLENPHDGTLSSVICAIGEEFGVTLRHRPDLGVTVFEIIGGV